MVPVTSKGLSPFKPTASKMIWITPAKMIKMSSCVQNSCSISRQVVPTSQLTINGGSPRGSLMKIYSNDMKIIIHHDLWKNIFFFLRRLFHRHWSHGQIPCLRGRRLGWGGSSPRASARRSKKGGGSPSVWSVAPKGSSSRLALKARWAAQLKRAAQRRV